jgi:hypothetical protein
MPVWLITWQLEGTIVIAADSADKALEDADTYRAIRDMSHHDVDCGTPIELTCLEQAVYHDATLDGGDFAVQESEFSLKELLPSNPQWESDFSRQHEAAMKARRLVNMDGGGI